MKTVKELLDGKGHEYVTIAADASALEAAQMMAEKGIGSLMVMDDGQMVGLISERDITYKLVAAGGSPGDTPVRDIMSSHILCVTPDKTVDECMALMTDKRVRHLPATADGRIVGVISIGDAVKAVIADQQFIIEQLESYITS
ncbi:MAG: CBS domain-containing protein [Gammaproteobacteria bacterium]|nr:MAG: CBS domain-containing protein [Gammaproteobacteria bacterium]